MVIAECAIYHPRRPETTPLYRLVQAHDLRPPVSLDRLRVNEDAGFLAYAARRRFSSGTGDEVARNPLDFLARIVMHIPEPRRHVIR